MTEDDECDLQARNDYRLELFLSVDVVGSTAFKFSANTTEAPQMPGDAAKVPKGWLGTIKKFYEEFHENISKSKLNENAEQDFYKIRLWKALGDELIYRVMIDDVHKAADVVQLFIRSVHHARKTIRKRSTSLDLKASAWVSDFPARNWMFDCNPLFDPYQGRDGKKLQLSSENSTENTDISVHDFIGPSMDAGFRLGKVASRRKMALSVELALILSRAQAEERRYPFIFGYDGREDLKGVLGGESYPVIWLDIEDDQKQREANRREAAMLQRQAEIPAESVVDFCEKFIEASSWMEFPFLKKAPLGRDEDYFSKVPESHKEYARGVISEKKIYQEDAPCEQGSDCNQGDGQGATNADELFDKIIAHYPAPHHAQDVRHGEKNESDGIE